MLPSKGLVNPQITVSKFETFPNSDVLDFIKHHILRNPDKDTDLLRQSLVGTEIHRLDVGHDHLVGFGILKVRQSRLGPLGEIKYIGVSAEERSRGVGKLLLASIEDSCTKKGIEVLDAIPEGTRAQEFYLKNGYRWANSTFMTVRKALYLTDLE